MLPLHYGPVIGNRASRSSDGEPCRRVRSVPSATWLQPQRSSWRDLNPRWCLYAPAVGHGCQSTQRELNPHTLHGEQEGCRYIMGACVPITTLSKSRPVGPKKKARVL